MWFRAVRDGNLELCRHLTESVAAGRSFAAVPGSFSESARSSRGFTVGLPCCRAIAAYVHMCICAYGTMHSQELAVTPRSWQELRHWFQATPDSQTVMKGRWDETGRGRRNSADSKGEFQEVRLRRCTANCFGYPLQAGSAGVECWKSRPSRGDVFTMWLEHSGHRTIGARQLFRMHWVLDSALAWGVEWYLPAKTGGFQIRTVSREGLSGFLQVAKQSLNPPRITEPAGTPCRFFGRYR